MKQQFQAAGRAQKRFGQHFLEPVWVDKLIRSINPEPDDVFLEIGPGRGALTFPLAARVRYVLAIEIDRHLASELRRRRKSNLGVLQGDFLQVPVDRLREELATTNGAAVRVAGNLPYNVASPILFRLMALRAAGLPIVDATVMVQREVADRLVAVPGTRQYGVLTVLVGQAATVERLMALPPGAFRPAPKVHSAALRLRFHDPEPQARNPAVFVSLVRSIFTRRRKTLANALKAFPIAALVDPGRALLKAELDGRRRPETLTLPELVRLADTFVTDNEPQLVVADRAVL